MPRRKNAHDNSAVRSVAMPTPAAIYAANPRTFLAHVSPSRRLDCISRPFADYSATPDGRDTPLFYLTFIKPRLPVRQPRRCCCRCGRGYRGHKSRENIRNGWNRDDREAGEVRVTVREMLHAGNSQTML